MSELLTLEHTSGQLCQSAADLFATTAVPPDVLNMSVTEALYVVHEQPAGLDPQAAAGWRPATRTPYVLLRRSDNGITQYLFREDFGNDNPDALAMVWGTTLPLTPATTNSRLAAAALDVLPQALIASRPYDRGTQHVVSIDGVPQLVDSTPATTKKNLWQRIGTLLGK